MGIASTRTASSGKRCRTPSSSRCASPRRPTRPPDSGIGPVVTPNWHVATDEGFATAVASGSVVASVSSDHIAKIDVTGLDSSTTDCPAANVREPIDGLIRHLCPMHPVAARAPRVRDVASPHQPPGSGMKAGAATWSSTGTGARSTKTHGYCCAPSFADTIVYRHGGECLPRRSSMNVPVQEAPASVST